VAVEKGGIMNNIVITTGGVGSILVRPCATR
jgi:hypothetical protein